MYIWQTHIKSLKHFLDANDAYQSYRATAIFILLSIVFGLLVSNLRFGYKATLYSSMYANMRLWALLELYWQGKPQSYIKIEETSIWYVYYECYHYTYQAYYKKPQTFFLMIMMLNKATELQLFLHCCPYFLVPKAWLQSDTKFKHVSKYAIMSLAWLF